MTRRAAASTPPTCRQPAATLYPHRAHCRPRPSERACARRYAHACPTPQTLEDAHTGFFDELGDVPKHRVSALNPADKVAETVIDLIRELAAEADLPREAPPTPAAKETADDSVHVVKPISSPASPVSILCADL